MLTICETPQPKVSTYKNRLQGINQESTRQHLYFAIHLPYTSQRIMLSHFTEDYSLFTVNTRAFRNRKLLVASILPFIHQ